MSSDPPGRQDPADSSPSASTPPAETTTGPPEADDETPVSDRVDSAHAGATEAGAPAADDHLGDEHRRPWGLPADPFATATSPEERGDAPGGGGDEDGGHGDDGDDGDGEEGEGSAKPQRGWGFWKELPVLIVVALVVAVVIKTFLVQAFYIPSASMRDTLLEGDRVMVNKLAYRFGDPSRGDVIVFDSPLHPHDDGENILEAVVRNIGEALGLSTPESALIKRVIAVGGDTIEILDNRVLVNGVVLDEPYLGESVRMSDFGPIDIPEDHVFVMGDNRNQSEDSRRFGPIHESTIIGNAFIKVWPPGRWGGL